MRNLNLILLIILFLVGTALAGDKILLKTKSSLLTQFVIERSDTGLTTFYLNELEPLDPDHSDTFCTSKTATLKKITSLPSESVDIKESAKPDVISFRSCGINSKDLLNVVDCKLKIDDQGNIKYFPKIIHRDVPIVFIVDTSLFPTSIKVITYKGKIPKSVWGDWHDQNNLTDHICKFGMVGEELWVKAVSTGGFTEGSCLYPDIIKEVFGCASVEYIDSRSFGDEMSL